MNLAVLFLGFGSFSLYGNEKRVSSRNPQLLEVRLWDDKSNVVSFVDHLDFKYTAHRIPYAIPRYKNCGYVMMQKGLDFKWTCQQKSRTDMTKNGKPEPAFVE